MEKSTTHIWHQASPLTTLFQHQRSLGSAGTRWPQQSLTNILPAVELFSPCGPRTSRTPLCSWGFSLPTRALPVIKLRSCRLCGFSLPKFTSPHHIPVEFCDSGCADCCVNPQISFLGVQDGLVLVWMYFMDTRHTKNFHAVPPSSFVSFL